MAGHDALHQALNVPAILNELDRQPVQQFGMTGKFSLSAKVRAGLDQSDPEELLPETIDCDSGSEGIFRINQPLSEI